MYVLYDLIKNQRQGPDLQIYFVSVFADPNGTATEVSQRHTSKEPLKSLLTMKGIGTIRSAIHANRVFAHLKVRRSYICVVNSGKAAPAKFPEMLLAKPSGEQRGGEHLRDRAEEVSDVVGDGRVREAQLARGRL